MTENRQHKIKALEALLVLNAKTGKKDAIEGLVSLRGDRLFSHAVRLSGDKEVARDIVQEAWIEIIRSLPRLKNDTSFLPWALCIVSRRVAALIRTRQKDRKLAEDYAQENLAVPEVFPDQSIDATKALQALQHLPSAQHATIALFYLEDMSVSDVAKALDVPVGTVKTRLMAARATLRTLLEGEQDGQARQAY